MATARKGKKLNKAWLHDHLTDPYVKLAQREGYRARAAYKLKEIDEQLHLLAPGPVRRRPRRGARAPGASTCGASSAAAPAPAPTSAGPAARHASSRSTCSSSSRSTASTSSRATSARPRSWPRWRPALGGRPVDVVLSDMAPNLSGIAASDAARMADLVELAIEFAQAPPAAGGRPGLQGLSRQRLQPARRNASRTSFRIVKPIKPKASRDKSAETFLVGIGLKPRASGVAILHA